MRSGLMLCWMLFEETGEDGEDLPKVFQMLLKWSNAMEFSVREMTILELALKQEIRRIERFWADNKGIPETVIPLYNERRTLLIRIKAGWAKDQWEGK